MNGFPHAAIRVRRIKEPVVQTRRGPAVEPRHQRLASLGLVLLILGAAATAQAAAPTANAGGNQTVNEQTTVNLDGTGSTDDGIITTYAWTQVGGPNVTLTGAGTATPSFTAPTVLVADSPLLLTFQLQVTDDELLTSTDTVQITVNAVNAVPVANAGTDQGVNEGTTVNLNGNGSSDSDGTIASYQWSQTGGPAVAGFPRSSASPGTSFTAPTVLVADSPALLTFNLVVTDNEGQASASDSVVITVNAVNAAPLANAGIDQGVNENTTVNLNGGGSSDPDGTIANYQWSQTGGPAVAGFPRSSASPGTSFTAPTVLVANSPVLLTFSLVVTDNEGQVSAADSVLITVSAVNANPTANAGPDQNVAENTLVNLNGSGSSDSDGSIASYAWTQIGGDVVVLNNTSVANPTFTAPNIPGNSAPKVLTFQLQVTDNEGATASDTVVITVSGVNVGPTANNDTATVPEDSVNFSINVIANDTDPDGDTLTVTTAFASHGTVTPSGGSVLYTPTANYFGGDTINYTITDGNGGFSSAVVNVTVQNVNDLPTAVNDAPPAIDEGGTIAGTFNVLTNDTDLDGDPLTATLVTGPVNASSFVLNPNGTFTYVHNGSNTTTDSFTYQANDGTGVSNTATVSITINPVNDVPVATDDGPFTVNEGGSIAGTFNVLANDTDADNDPLTAVLVTGPVNAASFTLNPNGTFNYVHNGSETLADSFTYQANDGTSPSNTATVSLTITPVNDVPQITGQQPLSTLEDTSLLIVLDNVLFTDPDNTAGDWTLTILPGANYTVASNTVTPALNFSGNLNVGAQVSDLAATSATATLLVSVSAVNDMPVLAAPIGEQFAVESSPFSLGIAGNFSDDDGDPLTYAASGLPASGNITFNTQTGVFSGTPRFEDARDNDPYIVTVTAADGKPGSTPATDTFNLNISALDRANVSLDITATPDPAMVNDELRWTFTTRNAAGPQPASNVRLSGAFIGSGLTVTSAGNCTVQAEVNQVTNFDCTVGSLPVGASSAIVLTTGTSVVGDVTAFANAEGADPLPIDPNLSDNSEQLAIGVAEAFSNGAVQILGNGMIRSVALGDVNGDGSLDLVAGTSAGQPVQIWLSSGFRDFATSPISLADLSANEGVALADFDEDGNLDLVVANGGGQNDVVYRNDGNGNFTVMATLSVATFGSGVAVGDFNNDNNWDIAVAANGGNPIYHGNGNGGFTLQRQLGSANSQDVAVADFNNDGDDDVVFANVGASSRIYNGGGSTTLQQFNIGDATSVAVGQFGGNARPDLVFGRVPTSIGEVPRNPVFINGSFGSPVALLGAAPTLDVLVGDIDQDGNDDIVFINASGVHQIWNGDGAGGFMLHSEQIVADGAVAGAVADFGFTDVGDPGGADLAMGGLVQPGLGVFLNDGFGNLGRGDAVPPVLTLKGSASVEVPSGSAYVDSGATAEDNIDGNISGSIRVTNPVNTAIVGSYTVTYNVTDFAGNPATPITRAVTVTPAAGTGGGGGGALSYWLLICLSVLLAVRVLHRERQAVRRLARNRNNRTLK